MTDKIKIKIHDVTVSVSPLSFAHKGEIQSLMMEAAKGDVKAGLEGTKLCIKYAVKSIEGVEDIDGNKYELEKENGFITDDCVEELLNSEMSAEISLSCIALLNNIPTQILDPTTNKPLKGVKVLRSGKSKAK